MLSSATVAPENPLNVLQTTFTVSASRATRCHATLAAAADDSGCREQPQRRGYSQLLLVAPRTAQAAGERLHNTPERFQVKELPELWIPFSPPPTLLPAPPTCQDSFLGHKGRIHLNLRKHAGKEKIIILQKRKSGGGGLIAGVKKTRQGSTCFCQNRRADSHTAPFVP